MQVQTSIVSRNSVTEFSKRAIDLVDAGVSVIHVRADETTRAVGLLRDLLIAEGGTYHEWDVVSGMVSKDITNKDDPKSMPDPSTIPLPAALNKMLSNSYDNPTEVAFYVFNNPTPFLEMPAVVHLISKANATLPCLDTRVFLVTKDIPMNKSLADDVGTLHLTPPGFTELKERTQELLDSLPEGSVDKLSEEDIRGLCYAGLGMSSDSYDAHLSLAVVEARDGGRAVSVDELMIGVNEGKTDIVNKSDLLELYGKELMSSVGGLDNLKRWVRERANCYSDAAQDYGIEPPKGIVLVGVPGAGKSLTAKAIASELNIPLVRLDFGKVFNSLVGASEERMRTALKAVEYMAPVVCLVDEIDKGLGGIGGGGGDSGTSSRVLGTFLTWLQDCKAPVFSVVTANNISGLPPELLRRGRFDAIFYAGLPTVGERQEVLKIHLAKRGWAEIIHADELHDLAVMSEGYVPAELESAVREALIIAFNRGGSSSLEAADLEEAIQSITPLSKSHAAAIDAMTEWAKINAIPASTVNKEKRSQKAGRGRLRKRVATAEIH